MRDDAQVLLPTAKEPRLIFFAGKGGVGKTSISSVTAVYLARLGYKTLLLTTDPASHLEDVFEQEVSGEVTKVAGVDNLDIVKIDPKAVAGEYKEKVLADAKAKDYSEEVLMGLKEELDSPCTEEMASFDKFVDYTEEDDYQIIVFDTAPTGHTLRLLELPMNWEQQLEFKTSINTSTQADLESQQKFKRVIARLEDKEQTTFSFVVYPENTPILEAHRAVEELETVNVKTQLVVANQILPTEYCTTPYFKKRRKMQEEHLANMEKKFNAPIIQMPLFAEEIQGLDTLIEAGKALYE
ncbi:arsenite efflux ATP-binding protein ArsA [Orenia metallireducens]|uniref:Arsenite efflux ATP-binding protein ArsA n=1 Tax=Orenia metallireducens TaxID=1413210 RepID=A0A285HH64_9FIRM|nr:ArsA family ATPase [Orenia metallireducens]PRX27169.1 arsenite efflux ATP-binding protein ArsA [Orenia metallireducens]SNY35090.1 arsenite efflux ATP-binding protein ArsA [Orenia metallireducens]